MRTAQEEFAIEFKGAIARMVAGLSTLKKEIDFLSSLTFNFPSDKTAWFLKGTAIALFSFIKETKESYRGNLKSISYLEIAKKCNDLLNKWGNNNDKLPLRGNALSNQLSRILGLLSSFSWFSGGIWISSIVTPKHGNEPSQGFYELVFQLTGRYPSRSDILKFQEEVFKKLN